MRLSLYELAAGVTVGERAEVVYDVEAGVAHVGAANVRGHALVWRVETEPARTEEPLLSHEIELDSRGDWIIRCDRVDFPAGGIAALHTHPGPGIRYLLQGRIDIETGGRTTSYAPGEAWFEAGPEPVRAVSSPDEPTSFVRVMLLPAAWEGKRTIRYVNPADADRPALQRATVFFDRPLVLP
jgi:quercetin dioxygenase-like cupin family protein